MIKHRGKYRHKDIVYCNSCGRVAHSCDACGKVVDCDDDGVVVARVSHDPEDDERFMFCAECANKDNQRDKEYEKMMNEIQAEMERK
jgi:Fe2+ or Zn2+ uptake regulation protein